MFQCDLASTQNVLAANVNQSGNLKRLQKLKRTCPFVQVDFTDSIFAICCHHPSAVPRIKLHEMMSFYFWQKREKMLINQDQM